MPSKKTDVVVPDTKMTAIELVRSRLEHLRVSGTHLFRCVSVDKTTKEIIDETPNEVCSAGHKTSPSGRNNYDYSTGKYKNDLRNYDDNVIFGLVYNGESPKNSCSPTGKLKGGEVSLAWLKFILDPVESPWRDALSAVTNAQDTDWINEAGGLIFEGFKIGGNAMGGLVIASRFCQEHHDKAQFWHKLVLDGMHPRLAYIVACTCNTKGNKVTLDGHMPLSSPSKLWAKACWELKADVGAPVSKSGYTGGDGLYNDKNSAEYKAYYGYNPDAKGAKYSYGDLNKVIEQIKEDVGYA